MSESPFGGPRQETIRLPGIPDADNAVLNHLVKELDEHSHRNKMRRDYYEAKRFQRHVGLNIPYKFYNLGITLGWAAKAVDILSDRCNLEAFVWPDGDIDSLGARKVWRDNALDTETNNAIISSLIHGVSFLINTSGLEGEPESLIHVKDALNATGDWNPRTRRLDNLLSITDREEGEITGLVLYLYNRTITAEREGKTWMVDVQEHPWGVPAEALVFKPCDRRPFGMSRISRPVMSMHDQALRTIIRLEAHADVFSYPELWMLGADPSVLTDGNGKTMPAWQAVLGRIKGIPDDDEAPESLARADIKQFQAASPQPHLDMLKQQAMFFSGETSVPLTSLGVSDTSNPTSAESYYASREDLIRLVKQSNRNWATPFSRSMIRALAIANNEPTIPEEWESISTQFEDPEYASKAAIADAGMKLISAAPWLADTPIGLEMLGMNQQQIDRAMADKRRSQASSLIEKLTMGPTQPNPITNQPVQQPAAVPQQDAVNGASGN